VAELDSLPPDHTPIGDLIRWLHAQLGRPPTLEELAELRCAMRVRTRRARSARPVAPRGRAQTVRDYTREILASEEGQAFLLALAVLPSLAATVVGASFGDEHAERRTNPDAILRLARDTRTAAKLYPGLGPQFEPPLRKMVKPVREYLTYKLAGGPDFGPAMASPGALCEPEILAAVNAAHEGQAREWRRRLDSNSDAAKRTALADMRATGRAVLSQYPLLGRTLPGGLPPAPAASADLDTPAPPAPTR
jgi:hypothetical protein